MAAQSNHAQTAPVAIANITIRQDAEGRYCLNDLHRASGGIAKHRPNEWLRLKQTKELVNEAELITGIPAIKTIKGHRATGTYAVRELVYAYAMWISAKFHLKVIRAYDALQQSQTPAPRPETVRLSGNSYIGNGIRIEGDKALMTFGIKTDELLFNLRQAGYELVHRNELPQRITELFPEHRLISRDEFQLFQLMREIFTVNEGGKPAISNQITGN